MRRSYEDIRNPRNSCVRVQTDISVLGNNECPPQERRALGYCIIEVGHRLENTQGGVPFLLTRPVATFEFNQS